MSQFTSVEQQASYGIGRQIGDQVASNPFEGLDATAVAQGVIDSLEGKEYAVEVEDLRAAFGVINERMQDAQAEQAKAASAEGQKFLDENAQREGVTVTESGLQLEVITEGSGEKPTAASTVKTHYHGTLIDGTVFDSSVDRGEPSKFMVGSVIKGWQEALQLMKAQGDAIGVRVPELITAAEGIAAEGGEFIEIVKKMQWQGKPLDEANVLHLKKELGDLMFYVMVACTALGVTGDEIVEMNKDKLEGRYKEGFTVDESENRVEGDI